MKPLLVLLALSLSPEAREFMDITAKLEPVQCEKRRLRREIALAEVEKKDARQLKSKAAGCAGDDVVLHGKRILRANQEN